MNFEDIEDYVIDVCELLGITAPQLLFTDKFKTPTMLASLEPDCLKLKQTNNFYDLCFAIAHELRHKWQIETDYDYYFSNYKDSTELDIIDYNMQIAELDANAFATLIMNDFFQVKPLFNNMTESVKTAINQRISEIKKEWN